MFYLFNQIIPALCGVIFVVIVLKRTRLLKYYKESRPRQPQTENDFVCPLRLGGIHGENIYLTEEERASVTKRTFLIPIIAFAASVVVASFFR